MSENWKIIWEINDIQVRNTLDFYNHHKKNPFVSDRERKNINKQGLDSSKEYLWKCLISCLLTTQQKSGPTSKVAQFEQTVPYPLNLQFCTDNISKLDSKAESVLKRFGGLRRTTIIAQQLKENLQNFKENDWLILKEIEAFKKANDINDKTRERRLAGFIQDEVKGFGPKQSRNFIQALGLTKYEIPIDSRITKWLNENGFPITLTASGLSDPYYYQFISDGIQELCVKANIYPCLLDAAIFSSYDKTEFHEE